MRLLEILSGYAFNLYFVKGKDMKLCDFLSRIDVDRGNPGEVIQISFNSFSMLNMIRKVTLQQTNKLMIVTRSASKAAGTAPPPVHGVKKHLDPNVKPEHDKPPQNQNKQKGPTSADAKPKVLLKPKLPASQIVRKRLIDKWVRRNIGGSVIRLDIARDTVSVDLNIKSARGHTSIHMTPWDSQSQYKRWSNTYKPRDRTAKQIDAFRAVERRARAILTSRHISLHRTAGRHRARWGLPPQSFGFDEFTNDPCDKPPMEYSLPPQDQRRAEVQEDKRVARGATSMWTSENSPSPAFPPPPSCKEEDLEELHMNKDQGPRSSDGQAPNAPHNYEEEETPQDNDYQSQGQLPYEDVSMDEDEDDPPEDLRKATALPKEAIGLKESPATYVPKSPKYVRDSEDEGAQDLDEDDIGTPHLAPQRNPEQGLATQDIQAVQALLLMKGEETGRPLVDYSSSDSVPELVCLSPSKSPTKGR